MSKFVTKTINDFLIMHMKRVNIYHLITYWIKIFSTLYVPRREREREKAF